MSARWLASVLANALTSSCGLGTLRLPTVNATRRIFWSRDPTFLGTETLELSVMERRKTGRPSKGDREEVKMRVPRPLADALRAEASRRGVTINNLLAEIASREVGVPYTNEESLPISA